MSAELVLAAQRGDQQAFTALVERWKGAVCAITLALTRDLSDSEDVAQDVFVKAWLKIGALRNPASFGPWVRELARNEARMFLRAADRRTRRVTVSEDVDVAGRGPSADDVLVRAERDQALQDALDALDDDVREVLILFYREGRSVRQVAELLELSEAAVKKRLSRARARLRDDVEQRLGETLQRSAPGVAFLGLVSRGIEGASAPPRGSALIGMLAYGVAILLVLGSLCGLALWWVLDEQDPDDLVVTAPAPSFQPSRPAATARARAVAPRATPPSVATEDVVALNVPLGDRARLQRNFRLVPGFGPQRWFPTTEEAPFPALATVDAVQDYLDLRAKGEFTAAKAMRGAIVEQAAEDGLTLDVDADPWTALLALEVERIREDLAWEAGVEPGTRWPDHQLEPLETAARTLRARHSGAVADYFTLYELYADADGTDPDLALQLDTLHDAVDPVVAEAAFASLAGTLQRTSETLEASDLDALEEVFAGTDGPDLQMMMAFVGLEHAMRSDDRSRTRRWARLLQDADERCEDQSFCTHQRREVHIAAGQLGAATTWQAAIAQAAWDCHERDPMSVELAGVGRVSGDGYHWDFTTTHPMVACLAQSDPRPLPPASTVVELTLSPQQILNLRLE